MPDPTQLTETGIDNLKFFVKFLAKHDLIDEAHQRLKDKGIDKLRISIDVVTEIQEMIKEKAQVTDGPTRAESAVITSAHNNNLG